jgi:hypothetical protein
LDRIFSDSNRFRQILLNLLGNANKFTVKGSIKVALRNKHGDLLKCKVIDTGIGIEEEHMSSIFLRFIKSPDEKGMNKYGCGLGLAISRTLAERLGGTIRVKSKVGEGSRFIFTIRTNMELNEEAKKKLMTPTVRPKQLHDSNSSKSCFVPHKALSSTPPPLEPIKEDWKCNEILVVDDDRICRDVLIHYLKKLNLTTDEVLIFII